MMLSCPTPCSNVLCRAKGCAVYIKSALIMFGVRRGLTCRSSAAAPATCGAGVAQHAAILDAIEARDSVAAQDAMGLIIREVMLLIADAERKGGAE